MSFGLYISGPGIVGRLLMRDLPEKPLIFEVESEAKERAEKLQKQRPYHHVRVIPYVEGDENRGQLARDPDGVWP